MKRAFVLFISLMTILMFGCGRVQEEKVNNVVRIFWHENTRYSVMVQDPATKHMRMVSLPRYACHESKDIEIVPDIATSDQMWVQMIVKYVSGGEPCIINMKIHVRSEKDVEGGGWTRREGKSTTGGSTSVIR